MSTSEKPTKQLYIEYYQTQDLLQDVLNLLPLVLKNTTSKKKPEADLYIDSIRERAIQIGLNKKLTELFLV